MISYFERRWARSKASRLIAIGSITPSLFLLLCLLLFVRDYGLRHTQSIRLDPLIFFSGALFGAALFGVSLVHQKDWVRAGIVLLSAAFAGGALFLAHVYSLLPRGFNHWTFDATQLEWKVPAAGALLLATGVLGALRRSGMKAWVTLGWPRALVIATASLTLVSTSHYPRKWRVSEIGCVWGVRMAANGDLFLDVTREGHPIGWGPEAVLIYEVGTQSLRCLSSRPLLTGRSPIISPDGSRVAMTELASPWALLMGRLGETKICNVRSGTKSAVWTVRSEDGFLGAVPDWTLILGPGESYLFEMDGILYGSLTTGAPFELPAGPCCSFPPALLGATIRFSDEEINLDTGKRTPISMPRIPEEGHLYQRTSPGGERLAIYVPSIAGDQVFVYVVGPNVSDLIFGASQVARIAEDIVWPSVCWRDDGSATLVSASQIEAAFSAYRDKGRYGNLAVLQCSRVREMHEIGGRIFAHLTDRMHGASDGLYEIDAGFEHAKLVRGAWKFQRIGDSIVYSTWDDPKGLVVRFWPKTNRREVLLAE